MIGTERQRQSSALCRRAPGDPGPKSAPPRVSQIV